MPGHELARFRIHEEFGMHVFADRDEALAAAFLELRNDAGQIIDGALVDVVKEEDAVQLALGPRVAFLVAQLGVVGGQALPVKAIQRPDDDAVAELVAELLQGNVAVAVGGAHGDRLGAEVAQNLVGFGELLLLGLVGELAHVGMAVGMASHFVAFGKHALHDLRVVGRIFAELEEGGGNAVVVQHVQQVGREYRRAVVEGDGAEVFAHGLVADGGASVDGRGLGLGLAGACGEEAQRQQSAHALLDKLRHGSLVEHACVLCFQGGVITTAGAGQQALSGGGRFFWTRCNFCLTLWPVFRKSRFLQGQLAQLVEHRLHTAGVASSSLALPTTLRNGS